MPDQTLQERLGLTDDHPVTIDVHDPMLRAVDAAALATEIAGRLASLAEQSPADRHGHARVTFAKCRELTTAVAGIATYLYADAYHTAMQAGRAELAAITQETP